MKTQPAHGPTKLRQPVPRRKWLLASSVGVWAGFALSAVCWVSLVVRQFCVNDQKKDEG